MIVHGFPSRLVCISAYVIYLTWYFPQRLLCNSNGHGNILTNPGIFAKKADALSGIVERNVLTNSSSRHYLFIFYNYSDSWVPQNCPHDDNQTSFQHLATPRQAVHRRSGQIMDSCFGPETCTSYATWIHLFYRTRRRGWKLWESWVWKERRHNC